MIESLYQQYLALNARADSLVSLPDYVRQHDRAVKEARRACNEIVQTAAASMADCVIKLRLAELCGDWNQVEGVIVDMQRLTLGGYPWDTPAKAA